MKKMKLNIQLFGGSVVIQTITETTNIDTNQSTFTIPAKMTTTGETHNYSNASMTMQWRYEGADSWTSLNKQTFSINKGSNVTKNWTLTLTHNDDGSLSNVQFRVSWYITDSTKGTTGATTFTPTYIPRKSDIQSITSGTTDYAPVLKWTPASASFKYIIRYLYGSWTYQTGWITPNSTAQQTFNSYTITGSSIAPYMTSSTTAQVLASLYTYTSDGHLVGDSNVYFNVTLNGNIVPSVSFSNVSEAGDVPSSWGVYVKNKSRIALSLSASGIYGSSISSYKISYYGGAVTTASSTTSYIQNAGTITFTGQVTDSRGRSASTTTSISVVDYYNPTISTAQVQRCDASGNIDNNGEYMYISYGASISSCSNKNTPSAVYKVGYRVHNTGNYTYVNLTTNANSYSASGVLFSDGIKAASATGTKVQFSTSNTYDIIFYVKDYFMEYTNLQTLDTGFDLINFNASGKALAIGQVSTATGNTEKLEVGVNTEINGNLSVSGEVSQLKRDSGTWWLGGRDYSVIRNIANTSNSWQPSVSNNTPLGDWSIGTLSEDFYFAYSTDSDYSSGTNIVKNYFITTDGKTNLKKCWLKTFNNYTQTISNEFAILNLEGADGSTNVFGGDMLFIWDNKIYFNYRVKKIRISANFFCENVGSWLGYGWFIVRDSNGNWTAGSIFSGVPGYYQSVSIPSTIIDVSNSTYVELLINNASYSSNSFNVRGGPNNTWVLAEVVEMEA